MSIKKILCVAGMAMAAVAFMAPAVAQANVKLTDPPGTALAPGAAVTATSSNLVTETPAGRFSCNNWTLHLELIVNGPTHVALDQLGEATTSECHFTTTEGVTLPVTITDGTVGVGAGENKSLTINTWGTGTTTTTFTSDIFHPLDPEHVGPPLARCHFEGKVHVRAEHETDILTVSPSVLTGTSEEGTCFPNTTISGEFTLETSNGAAVTIDHSTTG